MNWTGGTRVRHNRPSSDTTRLQKRYFAKVRAAQSSTPVFSHAGVLGSEHEAGSRGKRKKTTIPDFDIIVPRKDDAPQEVTLKRRRLLETDCTARDSTPESSIRSLNNGGQGVSKLKTKKQLLLEKDDWVCTTLARPLVLKHSKDGPRANRRARIAKFTEPPGLNLREPFTAPGNTRIGDAGEFEPVYNQTDYNPPERRTYTDRVEDRGRRSGGAFLNLSDGGYVQIGGSTQFGGSAATPYSFDGGRTEAREMSHISDETMLFDLDGRQEGYGTSFRQSQSSTQCRLETINNTFGRERQINVIRDGSEGAVYYHGNSRQENLGLDSYVTRGFPSSPLVPSQDDNDQILPVSRDRSRDGYLGSSKDLIGEIEEAVADIVPSSPSTILSTIHLRPDLASPPPMSLQPINGNNYYDPRYRFGQQDGYLACDQYQTANPDRKTLTGLNLNLLLQEVNEYPQNPSLMAYASSSDSSIGGFGEEGQDWKLGSNVSQLSHVQSGIDTETSVQGSASIDWEKFLKSDIVDENQGIEQEEEDPQRYLEEVGIWEKQPREEALVNDQWNHDGLTEYEGLYGNGLDQSSALEIPNIMPTTNKNTNIEDPGFSVIPENDSVDVPWRDFVTGSLSESEVQDSAQVGVEDEAMGELLAEVPGETKETITEKAGLSLDLDGDEDRAWRIFVFDGLDDKSDEESVKVPKPSKPTLTRKTSLKPISQFSEAIPPEAQLRDTPQPSSFVRDFDLQSTAGATVGSRSIPGSEIDTFATDSSPVNTSSSPFSSPISPVNTRAKTPKGKGKSTGEKKPIAAWLGKNRQKRGRNKDTQRKKLNESGEEEEVDVIEEW